MAEFRFQINGEQAVVDASPDTPLLWVVREQLGLTGSKFGCGMGLCGACTMHMDGQAIRSCSMPVQLVDGKTVTTIEGLSEGDELHPLQQAWIDQNVPQCGYCQSGQIMSAASLLARDPNPSDDAIRSAMSGNICRCGTYSRIHKAIKQAASTQVSGIWEPAPSASDALAPEQREVQA